jgi:aminoglycoside phosphotransferase (APT) family kinase protein
LLLAAGGGPDATRHRHRFEARGGRRLFTKLAEDPREREELRREAEVLDLLDRRLPATALLAPAPVGWSEEDGALHLETVEGEDLARRVTATGMLDAGVTTALGTALAVLHEEGRAAADEWPGDARSAPVGVHRPTPADNHRYSAGSLDVIVLLQRSAPLCAHLDRLCLPPPLETLVHGDVRLENVIAGGASGLRLVDWEFAGAGEGMWDVASFVASCIGAWLWSIPQIPAVSPERLVDEATLPLAAIRPGLGAFWTAYAARSQLHPPAALRRCIDLAAIRLAQLAVEAAADTEDLRAVSVMHLQVAHNMLDRPAAASDELLGLALRDG